MDIINFNLVMCQEFSLMAVQYLVMWLRLYHMIRISTNAHAVYLMTWLHQLDHLNQSLLETGTSDRNIIGCDLCLEFLGFRICLLFTPFHLPYQSL